ncbi:tyrosine-type recombinase/integrase [Aquimarina pacifica]|uniref:tyrosine-type recombinase/integrase n=1 Tax=Aquimarina pacifica TaxID=1296415 RepID=UPI0009E011F6
MNVLLSLLCSTGLRRSEQLNLIIWDIDSKSMLIKIRQAKGNRNRYTIRSRSVL